MTLSWSSASFHRFLSSMMIDSSSSTFSVFCYYDASSSADFSYILRTLHSSVLSSYFFLSSSISCIKLLLTSSFYDVDLIENSCSISELLDFSSITCIFSLSTSRSRIKDLSCSFLSSSWSQRMILALSSAIWLASSRRVCFSCKSDSYLV